MSVAYITRSATIVKRVAYLIAVIGAVASYGTQAELLLHWGMGAFSWVIPATVDLLAICAAVALAIPGFPDLKLAGGVLATATIVSIAANVTAGHNAGAKIAHAWPVVAYLLAELIASRLRRYIATLNTAPERAERPQINSESLAIAAAVVATRSHANCSHDATPTARAACRKALAGV
jgi:hypothetical protein